MEWNWNWNSQPITVLVAFADALLILHPGEAAGVAAAAAAGDGHRVQIEGMLVVGRHGDEILVGGRGRMGQSGGMGADDVTDVIQERQ